MSQLWRFLIQVVAEWDNLILLPVSEIWGSFQCHLCLWIWAKLKLKGEVINFAAGPFLFPSFSEKKPKMLIYLIREYLHILTSGRNLQHPDGWQVDSSSWSTDNRLLFHSSVGSGTWSFRSQLGKASEACSQSSITCCCCCCRRRDLHLKPGGVLGAPLWAGHHICGYTCMEESGTKRGCGSAPRI